MPKASHKEATRKRMPVEVKEGDTVFKDAKPGDVIIPVMGPTGVGKSTFINAATGRNDARVGHDLASCTAQIQHVTVHHPHHPNRRIVFVDTPGFNDGDEKDSEILRRISVWLARSYCDDMKLSGVIYLHDISESSWATSRIYFDMLRKMCGDNRMKNVILATTKWSQVTGNVGPRHEKQLSETYWKDMVSLGSRTARFENSPESALAIVDLILQNQPIDSLQIQQELVDLQKLIPETEAGKTLRYTLQELLDAQKQMDEQLRKEIARGDKQLRQRYEENRQKLRSTLKQLRKQKIPLSRRIASFFGLGA